MSITETQIQAIKDAHARGALDHQIASAAGVSLATVKRQRKRLGLATNYPPAQTGALGERLLEAEARRRGLTTQWRRRSGDGYDLYVAGQRIDVKTSMQHAKGTWRFCLHETRQSFHGRYSYHKDYAADCEYVALVALYPDEREPDIYFLSSQHLPSEVYLGKRDRYADFRNDWTALEDAQAELDAAASASRYPEECETAVLCPADGPAVYVRLSAAQRLPSADCQRFLSTPGADLRPYATRDQHPQPPL